VILEVAPLSIRPGQAEEFEDSFREAQSIIAAAPGYISHELLRCIEQPDQYVLLVRWESIEAHEQGFRNSPPYEKWKALLHHYYEPFPTVSHYALVERAAGTQRA